MLQDVLLAFIESAAAAQGNPGKAAKQNDEKQKRLAKLGR
jgi:hypothetical protein